MGSGNRTDFVLASRLEFKTADFDGIGPRSARVELDAGDGALLVSVSPPIGVSWGYVTECVVMRRHTGEPIASVVTRWRNTPLSPPETDAARWRQTVLVHVFYPPTEMERWPRPVDLRMAGTRTWAEMVPSAEFVSPHLAADSGGDGVIGPDEMIRMVDDVEAAAEDDRWTLDGAWEAGDPEVRRVLGVLVSVYTATKRYKGIATTDLTPELMARLDAVPGWAGFVDTRQPPRQPAVAAIVSFARREGHLRHTEGVIEGGVELEPAIQKVMHLALSAGLHLDDYAALTALGEVWKDAHQWRRANRTRR